jgi:hypothetical protein
MAALMHGTVKTLRGIKKRIIRLVNRFKKPDPRRVHFLHIGKTGGTAIRESLRHLDTSQDCKLVFHSHGTSIADVPSGEKVVFFLRDPISRFISGFYSRKRKGKPRHHAEWSKVERRVFEAFETPNELAIALLDSESSNRSVALEAMNHIRHLWHYNEWLVSTAYLESRSNDIMFVGFQESLDRDFEKLKAILNLDDEILLPTDQVGAHKSPPGLDKSLDDKARLNLKKWYEEDYEFFSYCKSLNFE